MKRKESSFSFAQNILKSLLAREPLPTMLSEAPSVIRTWIVYEGLSPFPNKSYLLRVCIISLLKTLWEKKKLLETSNFSFFHIVFNPSAGVSAIFNQIWNCRLHALSVYKGLKFVFWGRLIGVFITWNWWLHRSAGKSFRLHSIGASMRVALPRQTDWSP